VQLQYLRAANTSINAAVIKPVDFVRNLDVYMESRLNIRVHISKIVSVCFFYLRRLRHLHHTVDRDVRKRLVSALILFRIEYCNFSFAGLPAVTLAPPRRHESSSTFPGWSWTT
jgi:hypothetical protein